jgi:hypothetical protein
VAEAVVRLRFDELEASALIDTSGVLEHIVGPKDHLLVSAAPRETDALADEAGTDSHPARVRLHEEQALAPVISFVRNVNRLWRD